MWHLSPHGLFKLATFVSKTTCLNSGPSASDFSELKWEGYGNLGFQALPIKISDAEAIFNVETKLLLSMESKVQFLESS